MIGGRAQVPQHAYGPAGIESRTEDDLREEFGADVMSACEDEDPRSRRGARLDGSGW